LITEIKIAITKIIEVIGPRIVDSSVFVKEIKFIDEDKKLLEERKKDIELKIKDLETQNEELDKLKERLKKELTKHQKKLDKLNKRKENLLGLLQAATQATKRATGQYVYYIPPTLDELMKGTQAEKDFKQLVVEVDRMKDSLKMAEKC
jgi:chromosome segregation ATPase